MAHPGSPSTVPFLVQDLAGAIALMVLLVMGLHLPFLI